jgi:hypothetical protein
MLVCTRCGKGKNVQSFSRHKKGSSGSGGVWALRAPIHTRTQKANLHKYKGNKFCTQCLRIVKPKYQKPQASEVVVSA